MKGLDNYAADGAKGIDDLKKIVNVLGKQLKGKEWEDGILLQLSNCKQYLKLDYKVCFYIDEVTCNNDIIHETLIHSMQDTKIYLEQVP